MKLDTKNKNYKIINQNTVQVCAAFTGPTLFQRHLDENASWPKLKPLTTKQIKQFPTDIQTFLFYQIDFSRSLPCFLSVEYRGKRSISLIAADRNPGGMKPERVRSRWVVPSRWKSSFIEVKFTRGQGLREEPMAWRLELSTTAIAMHQHTRPWW